ncbi:hypothetical protein CEXT_223751 [Caerostris extrusa]|uniref:Uncharacterized protein n=1 Tax=Caerostris extrusa TaxID=172846 RepID=A0AAV4XWZ2_CAEEX|nr:hypothetical protein CEXT_223751 [Caerostris extrusa]
MRHDVHQPTTIGELQKQHQKRPGNAYSKLRQRVREKSVLFSPTFGTNETGISPLDYVNDLGAAMVLFTSLLCGIFAIWRVVIVFAHARRFFRLT